MEPEFLPIERRDLYRLLVVEPFRLIQDGVVRVEVGVALILRLESLTEGVHASGVVRRLGVPHAQPPPAWLLLALYAPQTGSRKSSQELSGVHSSIGISQCEARLVQMVFFGGRMFLASFWKASQ